MKTRIFLICLAFAAYSSTSPGVAAVEQLHGGLAATVLDLPSLLPLALCKGGHPPHLQKWPVRQQHDRLRRRATEESEWDREDQYDGPLSILK